MWPNFALLAVVFAAYAFAQEPQQAGLKPTYERRLQGEAARKAAAMAQRIAESEAADQYAEAIAVAEQLAALRKSKQGTDHYEFLDAEHRVRTLQKVASLPPQDHRTFREAKQYYDQAILLERQRKFAAAKPLYEKALAIVRKVLGEEHRDTAGSYNNLATNLARRQKYAQARPLYEKALAICRKVLGEEDPDTAWGYRTWPQTWPGSEKYAEARPLYVKALAIRRKVLGEEDRDTADSYNNLALNLGRQRKHAEAQPLYQQALVIYRKMLGEEDPDTADSYNNLAANLNSQRMYAEAQPLYEKALAIRREVLGEEHLDTAQVYEKLADNLARQRKYAEAQPVYQKAAAIYRKLFGADEEDPITAHWYDKLADNLNNQGKYAEAQPLLEKALAIHRKRLGEEDPDTASSYEKLADNLNNQGKYAAAQPLYEQALAIRRKVQGEEHGDTAASYTALAMNFWSQGKDAEAEAIFRKLDGDGEDNAPNTAQWYNKFADDLNTQGKYAEAQPLLEKALAIHRKRLGEEHPDTAKGYDSLADNLESQKKYAKAQPLLEKALAIRRKALGDQHLDTARGYSDLALNLSTQGKLAEAQPLLEKAQAIHRKLRGNEESETAHFYSRLATNLTILGKYAEAQPLLEKRLATDRKILGEEHPDTASSYSSLAMNSEWQGKYAEAQPLLEKALAIRRKVLGDQHPDTAESYFDLGVNLNSQGKYAEAGTALGQAARSYEASRLAAAARGLDRAAASVEKSPYPLLAAFHACRGDAVAATGALELNLARGLLDEQALRATLLPREAEAQGVLQQALAKLQPKILALLTQPNHTEGDEKELQALLGERRKVEQQLADLAIAVSQREVETLDHIRQALPADAALVAWVDVPSRGRQEHWVCLCRQQGLPVWERLPGSGPDGKWTDEDTSLPDRLRQVVLGEKSRGARAPAEVAKLARQLYAQRLAPLEKNLAGVRRLYVVPVDIMSRVPVELLTDQFTISYVPSGTMLRAAASGLGLRMRLYWRVGDPRFDDRPRKPAGVSLPPGGLLVSQVVPQGNAANSRIAADDVLLTYAGTELNEEAQLGQLIAGHTGDKTIPVTIWRNGQTVTRDVAPGKLGLLLAKEPAPRRRWPNGRVTGCWLRRGSKRGLHFPELVWNWRG